MFKISRVSLKLIFSILLYVSSNSMTLAQTLEDPKQYKSTSKNHIGISFGGSDFHVRDENASPLTYRNFGITSSIQYVRIGENSLHQVELTGYYGKLGIAYNEYNAINFRIGIRYDYVFRILKSKFFGHDFLIYTGGGFYSFLNVSKYQQHIRSTTNTLADSWYVAHSAEVTLFLENGDEFRNHFGLQMYLPFISNVSRPPYSLGTISQGRVNIFKLFGEMSPIWKNFILQLKIHYEYAIYKWLKIFAHYDFQYSSYGKPRRIAMFMNNFRMGTGIFF